jgi:hypothetical protein
LDVDAFFDFFWGARGHHFLLRNISDASLASVPQAHGPIGSAEKQKPGTLPCAGHGLDHKAAR